MCDYCLLRAVCTKGYSVNAVTEFQTASFLTVLPANLGQLSAIANVETRFILKTLSRIVTDELYLQRSTLFFIIIF